MSSTCHVVLLPFMAYGHLIPMADMAVLLASRGLQTTIVTTSSTAPRFSKSIQKTLNYTHQIALHIIEFTAVEPGLENPDQTLTTELVSRKLEALSTLQQPFEHFIKTSQPNCIVSDMFFPWTIETAAKFNIPRIAFNGSGFFPLCVSEAVRLYQLNSTDHHSDPNLPFIVPHLPHEIKLTRKQLPQLEGEEFKVFLKVISQAVEAEANSYGVIFNSFYELEPEYVVHYREVMKRKAWHIGPLLLCQNNLDDNLERGRKSSIDEYECLKWLDSKPSGSVVYVSFGSIVNVTRSQCYEIAMGLEACNKNFIWVIRDDQQIIMSMKNILDGFEAKGKGLIIKGWAPQVLILKHESVGAFVTHCGWNSVLEGVSCGVVMVAWPVNAEQFYNAKLVTDVLRVGVSIGDVEWSAEVRCEGVNRDAIRRAVERVMGAEEGDEMRMRARELKEKGKMAVEEGGSSYSDLTAFIQNIKEIKS